MTVVSRIKGIRSVDNAVAKELKPLLSDMREAIQQLNGDSTLGAVRYAEFLDLLKRGIRQIPLPTAGGGTGGNSVGADPYFIELKKQTDQALLDITAMFANATTSELLVRENAEYIDSVAADAAEMAEDLADQADQLAQQALDLLDLATDVDAIQIELDDPVTGLLATSTLVTATVSRVDAVEGTIDVITAQITSLESEIVDASALDPGIMWQFEGADDGWTSNATLTPNDFYIRVGAFASGYFRSPSGIAIDGRLYSRLVARIRRVSGSGWLGRASYATTGGGSHGIDTTNFHLTLATEPTFAGGGWIIITWDMELLTAGGDDWTTSIIHQIQLELSDDGSTIYEVDWVALGRIAPSYVTATVAALESRVTATEDGIDALSADITSLETRATDLEGDVSANTTAISTLNTRITTAEGEIDVNSAAITSLDSRLDDAESDISAQSTAISGLTTSVSSINGTLTTHAGLLTSLDSRLDAAEPTISSHSSAISSLTTSVSTINGTLTSHSSSLTSLDSRLDAAESDLTADAAALVALDTRLDNAEGTISSHSTSLTSLTSRVTSAEGVNTSQATALTNLDTRVTSNTSGISSAATAVTMLQVYGRDANRLNTLNSPGNATDWTFANADVVSITLGGRATVAARRRTSGNVQDTSKFIEIDPQGVYEVRVSVAKNLAHGYLYIGMYSSTDGSTVNGGGLPIWNRAIQGGHNTNPYWTYAGLASADHSAFVANTWYDFTFYILGQDADPSQCPAARIASQGLDRALSQGINSWAWAADGWRLPPGFRFALLRVLNYYNATQTDAYWNNVSITRLDNQRTATLTEEASVRASADNLLNAQWTIKVQVNGYVAGVGLAVVGGADGGLASSFNILADRFNIALPGVIGPTAVFTVGNINGVPTVGISGNLVVDGTIVTRHLVTQAITTPTIANGAITNRNGIWNATGPGVVVASGLQLLLTIPITCTGGQVDITFASDVIHNTNVNPQNCGLYVYRNGSALIDSITVSAVEVDNFLGRVIRRYPIKATDFPGAGVHTYQLYAFLPVGTGFWQPTFCGLEVVEVKK